MPLIFPKIFRVRQKLDVSHLGNVEAEALVELGRLRIADRVKTGQTVAITAGSRGLANYQSIMRAIVIGLKTAGAKPFIVPAMGSHGGATARGQRRLVESFGITEEAMECPIRSSMDTVAVCHTREGVPVHFDRQAFEADHVLVFNRVKPHTMFSGAIQSGLMKMMLIGLGKHTGAIAYHQAIRQLGFAQVVYSASAEIFAKCNILGGLAVVENSLDQTAAVKALLPNEFATEEPRLLEMALRLMPWLPFDDVDLLLVNQIGKEISGTGMDTNVIGRKFNDHTAVEGERPRVSRIAVRSLSGATKGNAVGIGIAEFCRSRAVQAADMEVTRINAAASGHATAAELPPDFETDRQMLKAAYASLSIRNTCDSKMLWIDDTKHLAELECSGVYLSEARCRDDLEILSDLRELPFESDGNLPELIAGN